MKPPETKGDAVFEGPGGYSAPVDRNVIGNTDGSKLQPILSRTMRADGEMWCCAFLRSRGLLVFSPGVSGMWKDVAAWY